MTMLKQEYEHTRMKKSLLMLLINRKNEFKMLEEAIFWNVPESKRPIKEQVEFILNFCLDISQAFKTWSGQRALEVNSDIKTLTFLRQLAHDKKTMTELCHLLNLSYTLAEESKVIYRRIQ